MNRRCYNCGSNLDNQPAMKGVSGLLCFPCLYNYDKQGGEIYLEQLKVYQSELIIWEKKYGDIWPKCERLLKIEHGISIICVLFGIASIYFLNNYFRIGLLLWLFIALFAFLNKVLRRKIDAYGCPSRPSVKEKARFHFNYDPEIYFDDSVSDPNPQWIRIENAYPPDWEERRTRCLSRDGNQCRLCGLTTRLHVHHVKPIAYGGTHSLQNLIVLCKSCHMQQYYYQHSLLVKHNIRAKRRYFVQTYVRADGVNVPAHSRRIGRRGKFWRGINYKRRGSK